MTQPNLPTWPPAGPFDVVVISDLHIGGRPGSDNDRGFRMMRQAGELSAFVRWCAERPLPTELVINGDFVDFLAEEHDKEAVGAKYLAHIWDQGLAVTIFDRVANAPRERPEEYELFDALRDFVSVDRHHLTILLGNHDVELSYPEVRAALHHRIGSRVEFIYDNQALARGELLVEHGNRYDPWNVVDHSGLRVVRSRMSRQLEHRPGSMIETPGSVIVASVVNDLKEQFPWVDLLKPEIEVMLPLVLALQPKRVRELPNFVGPAGRRGLTFYEDDQEPSSSRYISKGTGGRRSVQRNANSPPYDDIIASFRSALPSAWKRALSKTRRRTESETLQDIVQSVGPNRISLLREALRSAAAAEALTFTDDDDGASRYVSKAERYLQDGFRVVVFGHTHHPKSIPLRASDGGSGYYFNSGTWADVMRLPRHLFVRDETDESDGFDRMVVALSDLSSSDGWERYVERSSPFIHVPLVPSVDVRFGGRERAVLRGQPELYSWPERLPESS